MPVITKNYFVAIDQNPTGAPFTFNANGGTGLTLGATASWLYGGKSAITVKRAGRSLSTGTPYFELVTTWAALGVPTGATVQQVTANYYQGCATYTTGASSSIGAFQLLDASNVLTASIHPTVYSYTAAGSPSLTSTGSTPALALTNLGANIKLRLYIKPNTGNSSSAVVQLTIESMQVQITYSTPAPTVNGNFFQFF